MQNIKLFNKSLILLVLTLSVLVSIYSVTAYTKLCLADCEGTPIDNPRYRCDLGSSSRCSDPGYCEVCVTDAGYPTNPNRCLSQACSALNGSTSVDGTPPNFTIFSPIQSQIYNDDAVFLDMIVNELSTLDYYDNINGGGWTRLCEDCYSYIRSKSFEDGYNSIKFRATDLSGNEITKTINFTVDSEDPNIGGTEPNGDFANGNFHVEFKEANPKDLYLNYGNSISGYRNKKLNLATECTRNSADYSCNTNIDLRDYDGEKIEYWFNLTDIANNLDESNNEEVGVDLSPPVINSLTFTINGKRVTFTLSITESNLDKVEYYDNSASKPKWKSLCSKLTNGMCTKKVSFDDGQHNVDIRVKDEAGYSVIRAVSFFTDSEDPNIGDTEPNGNFANGNFHVEFEEANPKDLYLNYGNSISGFRNKKLNLATECAQDEKEYSCDTFADLTNYEGEEIEYWFNATDIVNNSDESLREEVEVDMTYPVINNPTSMYTIDEGDVTFNISITELNLEIVQYYDNSASSPRWRKLCTRLTNGYCKKEVSFGEGHHSVDIQVNDEAGNSIARRVEFDII